MGFVSHSHLQKSKSKHEGKRPTAADTTKVTTTVFVWAGLQKVIIIITITGWRLIGEKKIKNTTL